MTAARPDIASLFEIVSEDELNDLRDAFTGARPHPLSTLLGNLQAPSPTAVNTATAARLLNSRDPKWIGGIRKRILDTSAPANAASALAELRAYGGLLAAGLRVTPQEPGGKPSPEFLAEAEDGNSVLIEVHAKQIDGGMQVALNQHREKMKSQVDEFRAELAREGKQRGVFVGEPVEIAPFGRPDPDKSGDTISANVISRLCGIKGSEHQLRGDIANVLWLDLQDDYSWNLALGPREAHALSSWRGAMISGTLWYALYGWKGAPILEENLRSTDLRQTSTPMQHDGRFNRPTKLSAVVAAFPKALSVFEHPSPLVPLTNDFRLATMRLPWAKAELSLYNWEPGLVASLVELQKRAIMATAAVFAGTADRQSI